MRSRSYGSASLLQMIVIGVIVSGLDWPLCHCAMAQAPPSKNTGAPWPLRNFLIMMVTISVDVSIIGNYLIIGNITGNITGNYQ